MAQRKRQSSARKKSDGRKRKGDLTNDQSLAMFPGAVVSFKAPWAHLLAHGHKRCENRYNVLPEKWIMKPIAIHISSTGTRKEFLQIIKIQKIRKALSKIERFNNLPQEDLLDELNKSKGCIIGLLWFNRKPMPNETYPMEDVPIATQNHWYAHGCHAFNDFVRGHKGSLNFHHILIRSVMREFLAQIPVNYFLSAPRISFIHNLCFICIVYAFSGLWRTDNNIKTGKSKTTAHSLTQTSFLSHSRNFFVILLILISIY